MAKPKKKLARTVTEPKNLTLNARYGLKLNEFYLFTDQKKKTSSFEDYNWNTIEYNTQIPFVYKKAHRRTYGIIFEFYSVEFNRNIKISLNEFCDTGLFSGIKKLEPKQKRTRQKMSEKHTQQVINDVLAYARLFKWKDANPQFQFQLEQIYTRVEVRDCVSFCSKVLSIPESDVKQILKEYAGTL